MKLGLVIGLAIAGVVVIAGGSRRRASPRDGRAKPGKPVMLTSSVVAALPGSLTYDQYVKEANNATALALQKNLIVQGGKVLKKRAGEQFFPADEDRLRDIYSSQNAAWNERRKTLPPTTKDGGGYGEGGANSVYFAEAYRLPYVRVLIPVKPGFWEWQDRNYYGSVPATTKGQGLNILDIVGTVGNATLPWIPGYGTAANAALQGAIALGRGKSLKDAGLAAARGALPPYGQVAFDMGVGIGNGKSVDATAKEAALNYLESRYPGARQAYEKGRALA